MAQGVGDPAPTDLAGQTHQGERKEAVAMTYFRVLVTGSREWADAVAVDKALSAMAAGAAAGGYDGMTVVHGAARGADDLADSWAQLRKRAGQPIEPEPHPADWAGRGKAAGMERNLAMVKLGADVCVAFIGPCVARRCRRPKPHDSHGTEKCAAMAERYGIDVIPIRPAAGDVYGPTTEEETNR